MITTVRQKLEELGKINCEHNSLSFQEKGKGVKLTPSSNGEAIKIRVDDQSKNNGLPGLITNSARCDCLYFYQQPSRRHVFVVELKGNNYPEALKQLAATIKHESYQALLNKAKPNKHWAIAIVSKRVRRNPGREEEWEKDNPPYRLKLVSLEEDKTCKLTELIHPSK